jgi:SAM-dependent methyltransferase
MKTSLYDDLVDWYDLLDPVEHHKEEVEHFDALLASAIDGPFTTLLELGAGAGNNGFYFRRTRTCTLTDLSPAMLARSRAHNPDCEHIVGDMRDMRLDRQFDAVFVHDAVVHMCTEADLRRAATTAFVHTRPGGAALFVPDVVRESFRECHEDDANDGNDGRSMRYIAWVTDPNSDDSIYQVDYAFLLRDREGIRAVHVTHEEGLFAQATWVRVLTEAGFEVSLAERPLDDVEEAHAYTSELFVCRRPR